MSRSLLLPLLAVVLLLSACEKEVHINLSDGEAQLVVNGQIDINEPPFVSLTRSIGYFAKVDLTTLENAFVHGATVTVSDGSRSIRLREYQGDTGGVAKFYLYTIDTSDATAFDFRGVAGKFYTLSITTADGRNYTSITKIPYPKVVDSVVAVAPKPQPPKAPTALQLLVYYSDPDTTGNAVRYFTKRNHEPFYPGLNSVFNDEVVNGTKGAKFPLQAGSAKNRIDFSDSTGYVFRGDTVVLKWSAIDRNVFNFYQTLEYSLGTVGNPFSSPINVQSNISGGALGVWAGYGSTYSTVVVPK